MKAEAIPLMELYNTSNKAYVIPSYQRPFAWEPRKAEELLEAVLEDAEANAKLTSLGTLLFCKIVDTDLFGNGTALTISPANLWEVVDGQQRLTVFSIIGYALQEHLKALTAASPANGFIPGAVVDLESLFETSRSKKGTAVPVLIRDGDNFDSGYTSDLAKILNAFAGHTPLPGGVGPRLMTTYYEIKRWVDNNLNASNFTSFCTYFLTKCQVVQVIADDEDSAFTMFEPLNSTSEPLTAFEVYRSKAVRSLNVQFPEAELLLAYEKTKRDEVIKRSNDLIFTMAQTYSGLRPRIHFVPLKHYLDNNVTLAFVSSFEEAAVFYRTIWLEQTATDLWFDDEAKNCVRFLKAAKHEIVIPLLLRYYLGQRIDLGKVLKVVVAFFALWRTAYPTNALPSIYRNLFTPNHADDMSVVSGNALKSPQALASYFRSSLLGKIGALAAGQTEQQKWESEQTLNYEDLKVVSKLFIFLDMGGSIKANLVTTEPWTSGDDVEHIHAASLAPIPAGVQQIGNLTFLPSTVNRSLQATPWNDKREAYIWLAATTVMKSPTHYTSGNPVPKGVQDYLNSPQTLSLAHLGPIANYTTWGDAEIQQRTATLLGRVWNILYTGWLHP
ncbi:DUF262 domain-containing protein [Hymenobacter sp. GOD-10R]|uniref:DUF262 domain-containing protein n=1 Tax=Hymenobacter sp. GOD-10R TaxID=3093922 RepID=UPI002D766EFD|nr:DUF262 domain-containing protein [Hymenobacter sp. GOD-10R]WRQ31983.1 DUF262 domain-containing protein [Hymenobacter sp. GOD-10R]